MHATPASLLEALARRLRTVPERVPAARATEELLSWLETRAAQGHSPPVAFLRTAARLIYEHARLVIGPSHDDIDALAQRLAAVNDKRPQAARRTRSDWRNMARLVLENRHLPVVALFSDHPPSPAELLENVELPFAARYVEDPPEPTARRIASPPLIALLDRAQELLDATALDVADVSALVESLRADPGLNPSPAGHPVAAILRIRRRNSARFAAILQSDKRRGRPNPFRFSAGGT
jgi:hypothetical protein